MHIIHILVYLVVFNKLSNYNNNLLSVALDCVTLNIMYVKSNKKFQRSASLTGESNTN